VPRFSTLLKPRWDLIRRHHARLQKRPDPARARRMFRRRIKDAKRLQRLRVLAWAGVYFSVIMTIVGTVLALIGRVPWLEEALGAAGGIASSLTLLFVAAVFLISRILNYVEVDLYFYSAESRMKLPEGPGSSRGSTKRQRLSESKQ
jgi:cytochrome bd-type quinol oxidase subunit 1